MHFNLAAILFISTALAGPFALAANPRAKILNMEKMKSMKSMQMATNETMPLGYAVVSNRCQMPIYLWSVGETLSAQNTVMPGGEYSEVFRRDPQTGGIAIKITTVKDGLYTSAPQTVFAYNLVEDIVWYDLSDVFGDPFEGVSVSLLPSEPAILWEQGVPPSRSQVRMLDATTDLVLSVC